MSNFVIAVIALVPVFVAVAVLIVCVAITDWTMQRRKAKPVRTYGQLHPRVPIEPLYDHQVHGL